MIIIYNFSKYEPTKVNVFLIQGLTVWDWITIVYNIISQTNNSTAYST